MKPVLVIALGNPLMGDEGIGWHVAERLAADPRLPARVEVVWGGTDLLRLADRIAGRSRVILIDALLDGANPGDVSVFDSLAGLDPRQEHAHHLSVVEAVQLLSMVVPVPFTLLAVSVSSVEMRPDLSAELAASLPAIIDRVLEKLLSLTV
jgi:hydrogenase maturation protease